MPNSSQLVPHWQRGTLHPPTLSNISLHKACGERGAAWEHFSANLASTRALGMEVARRMQHPDHLPLQVVGVDAAEELRRLVQAIGSVRVPRLRCQGLEGSRTSWRGIPTALRRRRGCASGRWNNFLGAKTKPHVQASSSEYVALDRPVAERPLPDM